MAKKIIIITLILLIAIFVPIFWAANSTGFNINAWLSKMPVTKMFIKAPVMSEVNVIPVSPIEKENQELRSKITELENKVSSLEGEKTKIMSENAQSQQELIALREYKSQRENLIINTKQLASYYREMKPQAVVNIMNNMDDNTVLLILPLLETDQSGDILALMDPRRAALLTQILLGTINPPQIEEHNEI